MNDTTLTDRCPRCQTPQSGPGRMCHDCERRLCLGHDRRRHARHRPEDYELSPWQENAIRLMEDQA